MSERGETAQNGGPPDGSTKKGAKQARPVNESSKRRVQGAAKTVIKGRRNEQIYLERLSGRSARSLGAQFDLSPRQVHDIVKACREADIAELELNARWRPQQFAEEHLLGMEEAINTVRELELKNREQKNYSAELGALNKRIKLANERARFLQETGLMPGPAKLKLEAHLAALWRALARAFNEYDVDEEVRRALLRNLGFYAGDDVPPPEQWVPGEYEVAVGLGKEELDEERKDGEEKLQHDAEIERKRLRSKRARRRFNEGAEAAAVKAGLHDSGHDAH